MEIMEKVSHLKGLVEGMEYDLTTKEGKIFNEIIGILEEMALEIEGVCDDVDTLFDYADELDADLGEVETELFGDFDDEYDDCCDCETCDEYDTCDCDGDCANCTDEE